MSTGIRVTDDEPLPVVLVTMGTMHFQLDRLMGWLQGWLRDHPGQARMIVQHGASTPPASAEGFAMCGQEELLDLLRHSEVVVTQGGPGGIMDSRSCGIRPIVVPRLAALGEAVDDHQVRFCRYLAEAGLIEAVQTEEELRGALDAAVADPASVRIDAETSHVEQSVTHIGGLIDDLVRRRRPGHHWRRGHARGRRSAAAH